MRSLESRALRRGQTPGREENAWWRKNRDSKGLFTEELRGAREALRDRPKHQIYAYIAGEPVRRMLLEKTRCHVYYGAESAAKPRMVVRREYKPLDATRAVTKHAGEV